MADIRMVAMDLDGTLLAGDKSITEKTMRALRRCHDKGVKLILSSGRSFEAVRLFSKQIGIDDPIVSANGARIDCGVDGPIMREKCLSPESAKEVASVMMAQNVSFVCYARGIHYQIGEAAQTRGKVQKSPLDDGKYTLLYTPDVEAMLRDGTQAAYKFVAFCPNSPEDIGPLRKALESVPGISMSSSWFDNLEVMDETTGKGDALLYLGEHFSIKPEQMMAIGDQMNDWDMMRVAKWSVAMGNAAQQLKDFARLTTTDNNSDGVGRALTEYVLEEAFA